MIDESNLRPLPPPYEIFEFIPQQPVRFDVVKWEIGTMMIKPRYTATSEMKKIIAIRLHVTPESKPYFPHYWDLTPTRLVYQLAGLLPQGIPEGYVIQITRDIPGPKAHFSVEFVPK